MALHKRNIKNGKIQIDGKNVKVTDIDGGVETIWVRAWRRLNCQSYPELVIYEKDGNIPLYFDDGHTVAIVGNGVIKNDNE